MGSSRDDAGLEGKRLGSYRLEKRIGRGGMGDVYRAVGPRGKKCAVKVLSPLLARHDKGLARFSREAMAVQRLDHPNIVELIEIGEKRGLHFIAMELLRGSSFERMVRKGDRPMKLVAAFADVARGLAHAHAHDIVHRDLKPPNVLLTRSGRAKLADFGLARVTDQSSLTTDGAMLGTAQYMSPEQARGKRAGPPSDVYSLGVMLYQALAGELPFASETQHGFIFAHATEKAPKAKVRKGFPPALARLAARCMAKEPEARPSAQEAADILAEATRWRRRPRWHFVAAAAAIVVVGASAAVVAAPDLLDPIAGDWFGGTSVRAVQRAASDLRAFLL